MKKLLIPVDGSEQSLAAVRAAVREGPDAVAQIDLLNVQPLLHRHISQWVSRKARDEWRRERAGNAIEPALKVVTAAGIPVKTHVALGPVVAAILETAKRLGSEEIVVGATRHGTIARGLTNALSARLLEVSEVPVRVVPAAPRPFFERLALPAGLGIVALMFLASE